MSFVDEIKIFVRAGRGGDGVVRWRHEKGKEFGGPSGGNGGRGGDVYIEAVPDLSLLAHYKSQKKFEADNGNDGFRDSQYGKNGKDLIIKLPVGSVVKNLDTGEVFSLDKKDDKVLILKGGRGGLGNEYFKSSTNQTPEESTKGEQGEEGDFFVELQIVADIGLIGLPNAGKSSLLNVLTRAKAKVGAYAFTTLEPNLGDMYGIIIADIPGLIEGASEGRGLGHKFLRHIKRTRALLHCISLESEDMFADYQVIREEIASYDKDLLAKKEAILFTKADVLEQKERDRKITLFKNKLKDQKKQTICVSVYDDVFIKELVRWITTVDNHCLFGINI